VNPTTVAFWIGIERPEGPFPPPPHLRSGLPDCRSSIERAVSRVGSRGGENAACSSKRKPSSAGDRDFEPLEAATMATGSLSVGGLLVIGVSGDCVEASISDEPFDRRHGRSYPGPVWVDVCCDAPRVV
jgi:hypothetical protein